MMRKMVSIALFSLTLAALAAPAARAHDCDECLITFNGPAANVLTIGQAGEIVAVELR
jgi:hypothetical protein